MNETVFTTGGPVHPDDEKIYIQRKADHQLLQYCLEGEYSVVLTARQMGKTSLLYHTIRELKKYDVATVYIDLNKIGTGGVSADDWFKSVLDIIRDDLNIDVDIESFWDSYSNLSHGLRFSKFMHDVVVSSTDRQIIILIDEIELTTQLEYSDSFFSVIRSLYTERGNNPAIKKLSFVLVGMARVSDLIKQPDITTFNVGKRVDLNNFSTSELLPLIQTIPYPLGRQEELSHWIIEWTGGQPFLTQVVCEHLSQSEVQIESQDQVKEIVLDLLQLPDIQDKHINTIQRYLLGKPSITIMLGIYALILSGKTVLDFDNLLAIQYLKLSGILVAESGNLKVANGVYRQLFDISWLERQLGNLRTPLNIALGLAQTSLEGVSSGQNIAAKISDSLTEKSQSDLVDKDDLKPEKRSNRRLFFAGFLGIIVLGALVLLIFYVLNAPQPTTVNPASLENKIITVRATIIIWGSGLTILAALVALLYVSISSSWEEYYHQFEKNAVRMSKEQLKENRKNAAEFWKKNIREASSSSGDRVAAVLAQADVPFKIAEYYAMIFNSTVTFAIIFSLLSYPIAPEQNFTFASVGAIVGFFIPRFYVLGRRQNRLNQFVQKMPEALHIMINGIRSGYSTLQAVESVSVAMSGSISEEFNRVVKESQINIDEETAFSNLLRRIPSAELNALVAAIQLQRRVGGKLADALEALNSQLRDKVGRFSFQISAFQLYLVVFVEYILLGSLFGNYVSLALSTPLGSLLAVLNFLLISFPVVVIPRLNLGSDDNVWGLLLIPWLFFMPLSSTLKGLVILIVAMNLLSEPLYWLMQKLSPTLDKLILVFELMVALFLVGALFSPAQPTVNGYININYYVLIYLVFLLMISISVIFVSKRQTNYSQQTQLEIRIKEMSRWHGPVTSLEEVELSQPFADRIILPVLQKLGDVSATVSPKADIDSVQRKLEEGGWAGWLGAPAFVTIRLVLALVSATLSIFLFLDQSTQISSTGIYVSLGLFIFGFYLPDIWLNRAIYERKEDIVRELPHAINLLWICADVGLGLAASLKAVFESWDGVIALEFGRVTREVQLGKGIRESLEDMADRLQIPQISNLVFALVQSDQMGSSLSNTLRAYYNQLVNTQSQNDKSSKYVTVFISIGLSIIVSIALLTIGQAVALK